MTQKLGTPPPPPTPRALKSAERRAVQSTPSPDQPGSTSSGGPVQKTTPQASETSRSSLSDSYKKNKKTSKKEDADADAKEAVVKKLTAENKILADKVEKLHAIAKKAVARLKASKDPSLKECFEQFLYMYDLRNWGLDVTTWFVKQTVLVQDKVGFSILRSLGLIVPEEPGETDEEIIQRLKNRLQCIVRMDDVLLASVADESDEDPMYFSDRYLGLTEQWCTFIDAYIKKVLLGGKELPSWFTSYMDFRSTMEAAAEAPDMRTGAFLTAWNPAAGPAAAAAAAASASASSSSSAQKSSKRAKRTKEPEDEEDDLTDDCLERVTEEPQSPSLPVPVRPQRSKKPKTNE